MKNYKSEVEYKNDFNRKNYDHFNLMLPKGKKEEWKEQAKAEGLSLNAFIIMCVQNYTNDKKTV